MKSAGPGMTVKVHYTGKLNDGTVFDSSKSRDPLEVTLGNGHLIQGFENALAGMKAGDAKTVTIAADDAYGAHRHELVVQFDRAQFPENIDPGVGVQLNLKSPDGNVLNAVITAVEGDRVTLDANHPLAGKELTFEIEMVEVRQDTGGEHP